MNARVNVAVEDISNPNNVELLPFANNANKPETLSYDSLSEEDAGDIPLLAPTNELKAHVTSYRKNKVYPEHTETWTETITKPWYSIFDHLREGLGLGSDKEDALASYYHNKTYGDMEKITADALRQSNSKCQFSITKMLNFDHLTCLFCHGNNVFKC